MGNSGQVGERRILRNAPCLLINEIKCNFELTKPATAFSMRNLG